MKKTYVLIIFFLFLIVIVTFIGGFIVSGDKSIYNVQDVFIVQKNKEVYFSGYGYSLDNPNIIVNPYGNSPLTALVLFTTADYSEVNITIKGKDGGLDIKHSFNKEKYHFIPLYGLYAGYENQIIIESEGYEKYITIKTDSLPSDFKFVHDTVNTNFEFYNGKYPYAVDVNGEIRWYLNSDYYGNVTFDNGFIFIGSDRYNESGNVISVYKMNLLGKVYSEYILSEGYYGNNVIFNDNIVVLSEDILVIDIQTGKMTIIAHNEGYDYVDVSNNNIVVRNDSVFYEIDGESRTVVDYCVADEHGKFYNGNDDYNIVSAKRFGYLNESVTLDKNIMLLNYNEMELYDNIHVVEEFDRFKIVNNTNSKIYVIFDQFLDKRIYEVESVKYINKFGFTGKYTLYFKIEDKIYKTDYYIEV